MILLFIIRLLILICFYITATSVAMRTIVLADHLGIDKLTRAFGMVALFQGIAFMANAPFAGMDGLSVFDNGLISQNINTISHLIQGKGTAVYKI